MPRDPVVSLGIPLGDVLCASIVLVGDSAGGYALLPIDNI